MGTKEIHFRVPKEMWDRFVAVLPGNGERTTFLRRAVGVAIDWGARLEEVRKGIDNHLKEVIEDEKIDRSDWEIPVGVGLEHIPHPLGGRKKTGSGRDSDLEEGTPTSGDEGER